MHTENIKTIAFIGAHGSGKSTLGRKLASCLGWHFHDEIGERLRREKLAESLENHAQRCIPNFDRQIMEAELQRDLCQTFPRVVETWHPGNLAYALARSPDVHRQYAPLLKKHIAAFRSSVLLIPLRISHTTLQERRHEPGPDHASFDRFLLQIQDVALKQAQELELNYVEPIATDVATVAETIACIRERIALY